MFSNVSNIRFTKSVMQTFLFIYSTWKKKKFFFFCFVLFQSFLFFKLKIQICLFIYLSLFIFLNIFQIEQNKSNRIHFFFLLLLFVFFSLNSFLFRQTSMSSIEKQAAALDREAKGSFFLLLIEYHFFMNSYFN